MAHVLLSTPWIQAVRARWTFFAEQPRLARAILYLQARGLPSDPMCGLQMRRNLFFAGWNHSIHQSRVELSAFRVPIRASMGVCCIHTYLHVQSERRKGKRELRIRGARLKERQKAEGGSKSFPTQPFVAPYRILAISFCGPLFSWDGYVLEFWN